MSTLREAAEPDWLDEEPFYNAMQRYRCAPREDQREIVACFEAVKRLVRAELAKPDAPAAAPGGWQLVPVVPTMEMVEAARDVKRRRLLRAVEDTKAGREPNTMGVTMACDEEWRAMLAAAPRPAPAEPQGAEAPQEIKSLRDRIIEGELELDGTHPPTLMFLMAEHWKAVATEHYAKAKDYDRLKHELRLSRTAPAPRPAGGERERYEFVLAQCREAQDIAGWALNDIATASTTDPRARKIATEALLSTPSQPAAQQEPLTVDYSGCDICARETATIAGFRLMVDPSLPPDVLVFRQGEREVGRIINAGITATKGER